MSILFQKLNTFSSCFTILYRILWWYLPRNLDFYISSEQIYIIKIQSIPIIKWFFMPIIVCVISQLTNQNVLSIWPIRWERINIWPIRRAINLNDQWGNNSVSVHLSEISSSENGAIYRDADDGRMTPSWNRKNVVQHTEILTSKKKCDTYFVYIKHIS